MLATDRKRVHCQVVAWQTFRLAAKTPGATGDDDALADDVDASKRSMALRGEVAYHALCCDASGPRRCRAGPGT